MRSLPIPNVYYRIYRALLRLILPLYLRLQYRFESRLPAGRKIIVGNHPTVWDVFPGVIMFSNDVLHALVEDQIWTIPWVRMVLSLTNQVKMRRGVLSAASLRESMQWLERGDSLLLAPEGERTAVSETKAATRGVVWLAVKARAPLVPAGVWIADRDLFMRKVRYNFRGRRYTVDSYFPRFRARYFALVGEEIRLDQYYGKHLSAQDRQRIADSVLDRIYELKEEARRLCNGAGPTRRSR